MSQGYVNLLVICQIIFPTTLMALLVAVSVMQTVSQWKLLKSLGEKGWKSLVPLYNILSLGRAAGASVPVCAFTVIAGAAMLLFTVMGVSELIISGGISPTMSALSNGLSLIFLVGSFLLHSNVAEQAGKGKAYALLMTLIPFLFYWPCAIRVEENRTAGKRPIRTSAQSA